MAKKTAQGTKKASEGSVTKKTVIEEVIEEYIKQQALYREVIGKNVYTMRS